MLLKIKSALKEKDKTVNIDSYWDRLEEQHCIKDFGVSYKNIKF